MAFTYTTDPENVPLDALRLLVSDTDDHNQLLQDAELSYFLSTSSSIKAAAAQACRALATQFSRMADEVTGQVEVRWQQRAAEYAKRAKDYEDELTSIGSKNPDVFTGGTSLADVAARNANTDRTPDTFSMGQTDNLQSPVG